MAIKVYNVTIIPEGADGSAVGTSTLSFPKGGFLRAIAIDYTNQPVTTDILIKDSSTSGRTLHTRTSTNTDLLPTPLAMPSIDEGGASGAATDGTSGGYPFTTGLFFDVAQGDGGGVDKVVISCWVER